LPYSPAFSLPPASCHANLAFPLGPIDGLSGRHCHTTTLVTQGEPSPMCLPRARMAPAAFLSCCQWIRPTQTLRRRGSDVSCRRWAYLQALSARPGCRECVIVLGDTMWMVERSCCMAAASDCDCMEAPPLSLHPSICFRPYIYLRCYLPLLRCVAENGPAISLWRAHRHIVDPVHSYGNHGRHQCTVRAQW